jgi:hypothetical protein
LRWQTAEQQFSPALAIASAVIGNIKKTKSKRMSNIEQILTSISIFFVGGYMFFMFCGRNSNPKNSRYNEILDSKKITKHLIFAAIFLIIGMIRFDSYAFETLYFTPILFIASLLIFNQIIKKIYHRNILIEIRSNVSPYVNKRATFLDRLFGFVIILFSVITPLLIKKIN